HDFAGVGLEHAGSDLRIKISLEAADPQRGPRAIELGAEIRHAVGYGNDRAQRGDATLSAAHEGHERSAEPCQHRLHVPLLAVEGEDLLGLSTALLLNNGLKQLLLALEVNIKRPV